MKEKETNLFYYFTLLEILNFRRQKSVGSVYTRVLQLPATRAIKRPYT